MSNPLSHLHFPRRTLGSQPKVEDVASATPHATEAVAAAVVPGCFQSKPSVANARQLAEILHSTASR